MECCNPLKVSLATALDSPSSHIASRKLTNISSICRTASGKSISRSLNQFKKTFTALRYVTNVFIAITLRFNLTPFRSSVR